MSNIHKIKDERKKSYGSTKHTDIFKDPFVHLLVLLTDKQVWQHIDIAEKTKADAMKKIDDAWGM